MPASFTPCPLAPALAQRIRDAREVLTHRWLERISARVALDPNHVFPTSDLLNHVPLLIDGIAAYVEHPSQEVGADAPVIGKAMELGAMRHAQGFDEYQILKEYELLGGILFAHCIAEVRTMNEPCAKDELLACGHRLFRAIAIIQAASVAHYLQQMRARLAEREERLRGFNRALTHELKNQIGAVLGAGELLDLDGLPDVERPRLVGVVRLAYLPPVEVPAAAVELAVTNYLSNAIKYADRTKAERWVEVHGYTTEPGPDARPETVVEVRDNGIGVPAGKREALFGRGFRAHAETITGVEGMGLGLSIVKDAVEALGGRAWAVFPSDGGACFAFAIPARRAGEADAARGERPA